MNERHAAGLRLAFALRCIMSDRYMSLHYVYRPWWKWWGPLRWLEDANGHRYTEWPW